MPAHYYQDARTQQPEAEATRRLTLAVMEDALRCFQRYAERPNSDNQKALAQAEAWISDRNGQGPFAFRNICETQGIPPDKLRDGIHQWRIQFDSLDRRDIGSAIDVREMADRRWQGKKQLRPSFIFWLSKIDVSGWA